jgi:hypothetical protein
VAHGDCVVGGSCGNPASNPDATNDPLPEPDIPVPDPGDPDLDVTGLAFADSQGNIYSSANRNFDPMQRIYLRVRITNEGTSYPCCWSRTALYSDKPSSVSIGTASDIPMYLDSSNNWLPGTEASYESWSTGALHDRFTRSNFRKQNPGSYTFRAFADYDNRLFELNESNNQGTITYTILSPDLVIPGFELLDASGSARGTAGKPPFFTNDRIYPRVTFANTGNGRANTKDDTRYTYSYIYANRTQTIPVGSGTGATVLVRNGIFSAGFSRVYAPFPISVNPGAFPAKTYWTEPPGSYTATAFINYNNNAAEGNYTNNQSSLPYTVVTPYTISGKVCIDSNENGVCETNEEGYRGAIVSISGGQTSHLPAITATDGSYSFTPLQTGALSYTITATTSATTDYRRTSGTPLSRSITISAANVSNVDFGIMGKFAVNGVQFVDSNADGIKNGLEVNYTADLPTVAWRSRPSGAKKPLVTNNADGTYNIKNLISGQYTIRYSPPVTSGFNMVYPRPPDYVFTLGKACLPNGTTFDNTHGATCSMVSAATTISNLNFAITQNVPWMQAYGADIRFDQALSNPLPATAINAACPSSPQKYTIAQIPGSSAPGVVFAGTTNPTFGSGVPSVNNWLVSGSVYGAAFKPVNQNTLRTSYAYVQTSMRQQGLVPVDLTTHATCSTLTSCSIGNTLLDGVYQANGNVTLNSMTLPATGTHQYVILVNGTLTINTPIDVPLGQSLVFIVSDNIVVTSTVGTLPPFTLCPAPSTLEGFFSTDDSFIVQGTNSCPTVDRMLAMEGGIVVNAAYTGGTFQSNRNICGSNDFPSFSIRDRPDMLLNMHSILRIPSSTWQEVAP